MQPRTSKGDFLSALAALLVVGLFCGMMAGYYVPVYNGTDENGYLCSAERIAQTGDSAKYTSHPLEFVSENVVQVGDNVFYAKYPLGYPWLAALAIRLGGLSAAFLVNPILGALAVLGMFFLARAMIGPLAGVLAALLLATNSMHATFALSALSHTAAICFAVWSMYFLWRWVQTGGWVNAFAAGGLAAYTYTIRYTEALLVLPLVAMVVWRYFTLPEGASPTERSVRVRRWRREALLMAGGVLLFALPLLIHHWLAFGRPWRTGYDLCGESTGFGWKWFQENWWLMLTRLNTPGLVLIFPLGLIGLGYLLTHDPKRGVLLGLWALPAMLLYTAYYWAPQGNGVGYARFFVSVFPALIVCALALLEGVSRPRPIWSVALGIFVAIVVTDNLHETLPDLQTQTERLTQVLQTNAEVRRQVPEGAIIVGPNATLCDLEYVGHYEMYTYETFDHQAIKRRLKILEDHDPHPLQRDKAQALARTVGDLNDSQLASLQRALIATNIAAGRAVVAVGSTDQFRNIRGRLGEAFDYDKTAEWVTVNYPKNAAPHETPWVMYRLEPRSVQPHPAANLAALEAKIDREQFHVHLLRDDFEQRYPGARQLWDQITETEKQLKDLRDQARQLAVRKPKPIPTTGGGTNQSASLTAGIIVTNLAGKVVRPN